ncbi:MAG: elongation factor G [Archangium sp.]|nr:elongation factor G [Archangium sp.]
MTSITTRRLFGVLAHVDAGKTTVSERLLVRTGKLRRAGEVHHGNTALDHDDVERKHGITITAAATTITWREHTLSLIDTPGHIDFAIEVERSLRVLDGAVIVLDASRGVEPQTESVWRAAERHRVPRIVFINKLDAPGADVQACLNDLRERLGARPVLLQKVEADCLVDLVEQRELRFDADGTMHVTACTTLPTAARDRLIEAVAEHDSVLMQTWASGEEVSVAQLKAALRRACLSRAIVPVVCGAALKNRGIQPLLDAVVDCLPSPEDRPLPHGLKPDPSAPLCGFVFKTEVDVHSGALAWTRIFQGTVYPGDALVLRPEGKTERVQKVTELHGAKSTEVESAGPGSIAVLVGLKSAHTGNTVTASSLKVELEGVSAADPVVEMALTTRTSEEQAKLGEALRKACFEDPSLRVRYDSETGETVLCGVGELHLSIWLEKLEQREGLKVKTGAPVVAYRDTVKGEATVEYRHVRQSGGPGQFAVITLRVRPLSRGSGFSFVDETSGGVIPAPLIAAVKEGVKGALMRGAREGVQLVDVEAVLLDGQTHAKDSSAVAFEIAGSLALQEAAVKAGLVRLEPMANAVVHVPEASLGAVLGELASRRGSVSAMTVEGTQAVVRASLPLAKTFGLVTSLRSRSEGRADTALSVAGYEVQQQ